MKNKNKKVFSYMSRGEKEWNCWSLPYVFGSRDRVGNTIKMTINTITSKRYKTANTSQDQLEFERWK